MISALFNIAALRQFTKYNIFSDKIKLILDTPGLNKTTELTLTFINEINQNERLITIICH